MKRNVQHIMKLEDLWLGYEPGKPLLKSATADIRKGEMIAVAGRNGTGKSTLLRTLSGIQRPLRGRVLLDGRPLDNFEKWDLARQISFAGTGSRTTEDLTVYEMVSLGRHPYTNWWGTLRGSDQEKIEESLEFTGMKDFRNAKVSRLSDGERQRVMIAMALAQDTGVIILDEPTAFLDIPNRIEVVEVLHRLRTQNRTVIFSTHDFDNVFSYADKVWIMHEMSLVIGAPEELGMQGVYEEIFRDARLDFDRQNLRFIRKGVVSGKIVLEGKDEAGRFWTSRAIVRAGYQVVEKCNEKACAVVHVKNNNGVFHWVFEKEGTTFEFDSLYEMIMHLS